MPRARTLALAAFVSLASFGLGAGLAYRWLLREMLLQQAGRTPTLAAVLRPRGTEGRALLWGIAFLPVFWGGFLTFWSPLLLIDASKAGAALVPWVVVAILALAMRLLYSHAWPLTGEMEPAADPADPGADPATAFETTAGAGFAAWRRHLKVALWCGLPGLVLCSIAILAEGPAPVAILALVAILPALLAPWIGALSALGVVARGGRLPTQVHAPASPHSWAVRIAVAVAALSLLGLWGERAADLFAAPRFAPLLEDSDFAMERQCYGGYSGIPELTPPPPAEGVEARLARAAVPCGAQPIQLGEIDLGDQSLGWCRQAVVDSPAHFVALGRDGRVLARRTFEPQSSVLTTREGVLLLDREPDGLRLVRLGREARVTAAWRVPGWSPGSWVALERSRQGDLVLAWDHAGRDVGVARLSDDLVPRAPTRILEAPPGQHAMSAGAKTCVHVYGPERTTLVLDDRNRVVRPPLGERLAARGATAFHLAWTGLVLVAGIALALGSGRARRRLARSAVTEGTLTVPEDGVATLRRLDGELVRVRSDGAAWHGFADGQRHEGPCVVIGASATTGAAAYRSAPAEIDAAASFGIARGDLAQAYAWAAGHRDRILLTTTLVGWLVTGPTLLLLLVA